MTEQKINWQLSLLGVFMVTVTACSSSPTKIDTEIESKGSSQFGVIGLKDGKAIIQEESHADQELRWQQWRNYESERNLNDEYYWMKRCRVELADPRLGGNGQVADIPEIADVKSPTQVREEFGITDTGQLKLVKREDYLERLKSERKYEETLTGMIKTIHKSRETCEREMGYARVKSGLPATRYQGRSTYTDEGSIKATLQEHENSLDDAFRIRDGSKNRGLAGENNK